MYNSEGWIYTIARAIEHRSMKNTRSIQTIRFIRIPKPLIVHGIYSLYQLRHRNRDNAPPVQCHRNESRIFTTATGRRLSEEKSSLTTCRPTRVSSSRANREFPTPLYEFVNVNVEIISEFRRVSIVFSFKFSEFDYVLDKYSGKWEQILFFKMR